MESSNADIYRQSQMLMNYIAERRPKVSASQRVGLSGPPGAGKSTFIEALGTYVVQAKGRKLAVLVRPICVLPCVPCLLSHCLCARQACAHFHTT